MPERLIFTDAFCLLRIANQRRSGPAAHHHARHRFRGNAQIVARSLCSELIRAAGRVHTGKIFCAGAMSINRQMRNQPIGGAPHTLLRFREQSRCTTDPVLRRTARRRRARARSQLSTTSRRPLESGGYQF